MAKGYGDQDDFPVLADPFAALSVGPPDFSQVVCVLGIFDLQRRMILRAALAERGIGEIHEVVRRDDLQNEIATRRPDLVLCDQALPGGDVAEIVHALRHGLVGESPFPVVATLAGEPVSDKVCSLVDAGVDDLMTLPVAPRAAISRTLSLIERRRPFIVTSEYLGPDRRNAQRSSDTPAHLRLEVPNTLRLKAFGQYRREAVAEEVRALGEEINRRKIRRHAERIIALAGGVLPRLRLGLQDDQSRATLSRMGVLAEEIEGRLRRDSTLTQGGDVCEALGALTHRLGAANPAVTDIELCDQLIAALGRAFAEPD